MITRSLAARRLAALLALTAACPASAQFWRGGGQGGTPTDQVPKILEEVGVEEKLGAQVPLDAVLRDDQGRPVALGSLFKDGKPVVLALVYYECPMLCGLVQSGLARAMRENGLLAGRDFKAVSISFDPAEKPALAHERRRGYLQSMGLDESSSAWSFWLDQDGAARRIADAVGFHYVKDPASGEWAHLAAIMVLAPDGRVSRYLYGIDYPPKDFRLSLVEAAEGRIGTSFDKLILTCFRYDPATRKYQPFALGFIRIGGLLAVAGLGGLIGGMVWRERRKAGRAA